MASYYRNITTNTTTIVKYGAGTLKRIVLNKKATGAGGLAIYANTAGSGSLIGSLDWTNGNIGDVEYDVSFSTGLTIVSTAATSAGDATVVWE